MNLSPPALAFERWFQTNEMLYQESFEKKKKITWTSIQKGASAPAADILKQDLVRASYSTGEAERIVCATYQHTATAALDLVTKRAELEKKKNNKKKAPNAVQVVRHAHTLDLFLSKKHILKLNHEHYDKLAALWKVSHDDSTTDDDDDTTTTTAAFHNDLYSLLARYYSIQGPGFQAACPEQVFDILAMQTEKTGLAVTHECFASPLNCYYGSYCSAFEDIDGPFGTSGSFWDFSPTQGGSFQANPPFVHHVMVKMVEKIESLLLKGNEENNAFSFVVIVPVWLEESSYQQMVQSNFLVNHWIIAKADHGFCDGAQHQRRDRYRVSPYDTAIFILQNKAGRIQYPLPENLQNDLRAAFATGVPTEAAMKRRKRDGRGETDEDGGGGVYKGKKRNRTGAGVEQRKSKERMSNSNNKPKKKSK